MSCVTNLILSLPVGDEETEQREIAEVNRYFATRSRNHEGPLVSVDDDRLPRGWYGGLRHLEATLYIGAFNYLILADLMDHLRSIAWSEPDQVQVIIKEQGDEVFRILTLAEAT